MPHFTLFPAHVSPHTGSHTRHHTCSHTRPLTYPPSFNHVLTPPPLLTHVLQVVSDDSVEVWRQLERNLVEAKELLSKREGCVAEVDR